MEAASTGVDTPALPVEVLLDADSHFYFGLWRGVVSLAQVLVLTFILQSMGHRVTRVDQEA